MHKKIPVPYGSIYCAYHQLGTHLLTAQTNKRQETHKRAYLSENEGFGEKEVRRIGQKQNRIRQKEQQD